MSSDKYILLTIDVEDWFQVENFKPWIPFSTWDQRELRVEKNTHRLLNLFDSSKTAGKLEARSWKADRLESYKAKMPEGSKEVELSSLPASEPQASSNEPSSLQASQNMAEGKPKATFFVLGWIAKKLPHLVREIHSRGHEVASHGCNHDLPNLLSHKGLKDDLSESKTLIEDILGEPVFGYRAPSFAVNKQILERIAESGYLYDSSYNSFELHGRYGRVDFSNNGRAGIAFKIRDGFHELPVSNFRLASRHFPLGGGGYFRLLPLSVFHIGIRRILREKSAYIFYMHPWELDPGQPRVESASWVYRFRHYANLHKTNPKLKRLISKFHDCHFVTCTDYIREITKTQV